MSFGKNPYVEKAQVAEQKATDASDEMARTRLRREAAREWDRAAEREKPGKKRDEYLRSAEQNRALADAPPEEAGEGAAEDGPELTSPAEKSWN